MSLCYVKNGDGSPGLYSDTRITIDLSIGHGSALPPKTVPAQKSYCLIQTDCMLLYLKAKVGSSVSNGHISGIALSSLPPSITSERFVCCVNTKKQ